MNKSKTLCSTAPNLALFADMTDANKNAPQQAPRSARILGNLGLYILAVFPLAISCVLRRGFAPLDGFYPGDLFYPPEPGFGQWRLVSACCLSVLALVGVFKRPFAMTVVGLICFSPLLLAIRLVYLVSQFSDM